MTDILKELIVRPKGGLGNRLRVILSGLRITEQYNAKLTIMFKEGQLERLIELPESVQVIKTLPPDFKSYTHFKTIKGNGARYDFSCSEKVFYKGCYQFDDVSAPPFNIFDYPKYIRPSALVLKKVDRLSNSFRLPKDFIGIHIRRGDHIKCKQLLPDDLIIKKIHNLIDEKKDTSILLACEDVRLRTCLKDMHPDRITIISTKTKAWDQRFNVNSVMDDFAELLLMSKADYIIGTEYSSYSTLMIAYNGNPSSYRFGKNYQSNH